MIDSARPDFLSVPDLLKATPAEEGGKRFVYLEASNEARDFQGEVVLAKALADSASYYERYGNLDLDHITQVGAKRGIADHHDYEIGKPVQVAVDGARTMVKGAIYDGDGPAAARANSFWDSIANMRPRKRWYPSVGGAVLDRGQRIEASGPVPVVRAVRWTNIGFSQTPVNPAVPEVSTVPFGVLRKAWGSDGLDLDLAKTLTAGGGTDSATLSGGAALRGQSLDKRVQNYWQFRDRAAADLLAKAVDGSAAALTEHGHAAYGLTRDQASAWALRFHADLADGLSKGTHR